MIAMTMIKILTPALAFTLLQTAASAQLPGTRTQASLYQALNGAPAIPTITNNNLSGTLQPGVIQKTVATQSPCLSQNCSELDIKYELPGFADIDLFLLAGYVDDKLSQAQANLHDFQTSYPDYNAQPFIDQVNFYQEIYDNLHGPCAYQDFAPWSLSLFANVLFNDPVSGQIGLIPTNQQASVDLQSLFQSVPPAVFNNVPSRGTFLLYTKK
jgi:hypothetical protein